ncbi:diguanylate cyclase domain-containing protein [Ureibacillus composti]
MEIYIKRIILISILIIVSSIFDILDDTIIRIFNFQDEGTFEIMVDFLGPIIEVSLMFWALLSGKKAICQIKNEEEQYKRLVQLSPEAILIHKKGKIIFINESGANLFGLSSTNELINRNLEEFVHHDSKDIIKKLKENSDQFPNREFNEQIKFRRADGDMIYLEFKSTKIEFKGQSVRELIARDITIQKHELDNVKRLAFEDELTGLPNRRAIMDQLSHLMKTSKMQQTKIGVMFIDLDGFKQVNDSLGHDGGDILLKQVSKLFKKCVAEKGIVARLGGDEFLVLFDQINDQDCIMAAEKMIESLNSPIIIFGKRAQVTPSIGIALYPQHGHEATELIKNADMAMYQAKQRGKNNYQIYETHNKRNNII